MAIHIANRGMWARVAADGIICDKDNSVSPENGPNGL
jgi:hypothetical protein